MSGMSGTLTIPLYRDAVSPPERIEKGTAARDVPDSRELNRGGRGGRRGRAGPERTSPSDERGSDAADPSDASDHHSSALTSPLATSRGLGNDELGTHGLPEVVEQTKMMRARPCRRSRRRARSQSASISGIAVRIRVRRCRSRRRPAGMPAWRSDAVIPSRAPQAEPLSFRGPLGFGMTASK